MAASRLVRAGTVKKGGTGNLVALGAGEIGHDTGVSGGVKLASRGPLWGSSAGARDLEVDALGVVLGAILLGSRVQGDDLVTENILAGSNAVWNSDGPGVVVLDELGGSPFAVFVSRRSDLEELEVRRLGGRGIVDLGQVI